MGIRGGQDCSKAKVRESKMVQDPGDHEAGPVPGNIGSSECSNSPVLCAVPTV